MPRLRRVDVSEPGLCRRRRGRGFQYLDEHGEAIADDATLSRIRELAIPPAWRDVWICPHPRGHIQATGVDAAGRKQYLYHRAWRERRDQAKFDDMVAFARALPRVRRRVAGDLQRPGLDRERVLACAVRMLDIGFFRVGSEGYAERNDSYGLATIEKRHVRVTDDAIVFDYPAKSGRRRIQSVGDPDIGDVLGALKRRRGGGPSAGLLAYKRAGRWVDVRSEDINEHLKELAGAEFSAKDFRTWNATVLAAVALAERAREATSKTSRRRAVSGAVKEVARYLGNTPAVCRASYIDPRVIERFEQRLTIAERLVEAAGPDEDGDEGPEHVGELSVGRRVEQAVLDLIAGEAGSDAVQRAA